MSKQTGNLVRRFGQGGFTLIELMIVVVVVAILTAIAVPAYGEQVRKTRRAQARSDIMATVQALERFHTANNTYSGYPTAGVNSPSTGTAFYVITPSNLGATTYTLTAAPIAGRDQAKDRCASLSITQVGTKATTSGLPVADCW